MFVSVVIIYAILINKILTKIYVNLLKSTKIKNFIAYVAIIKKTM